MRRFLFTLAVGLASLPALAAGGITVKAKGTFRDGVYTSPDHSYSVRMPELVRPGIVISDQSLPGGEGVVYFRDDFCRQYYVHDIPLESPYVTTDELARYARDGIARSWTELKQSRFVSVEPVDIGRGPAVALRQVEPSGPCAAMTVVDGRMQRAAVPAGVLSYVFVADGAAWEVGVMMGTLFAEPTAAAPEPPHDALRKFLAGLETRAHPRKLQRNGLREGIEDRTGLVSEGLYAGKDGLRVTLPPLWGGARLEQVEPSPSEVLLLISDGLCRSYLVHPMRVGRSLADEQLRQLAEAMARSYVEGERATIEGVEPVDLGRGEGQSLAIRYHLPDQACTFGLGGGTPETVPVDATLYLFQERGVVYEVLYQRARATQATPFFTRREPADALLLELIAGIRIEP